MKRSSNSILAAGTAVLRRMRARGGAHNIPPAEEDTPIADAATAAALTEALRAQGYVVADDGAYLVDFALAERPAATSVSTGESTAPLSAAKKRKPLQSCKDQTHRLTLTVADRKSGATVYRGSAEEHHCKATLAENTATLIGAIVADLKQPGGVRVLKRGGRN